MAGQYIEPVFASSSVLPSFSPGALPSLCGICRGWGRSQLCVPCRERFAPRLARCQRCALRVPEGQPLCGACLRTPPAFDSAVAAFDYAHPWDALITRFKFQAAVELAPALAQCMVRAVEQHVPERPTLLLPVPLSQARQRERGYNQSWELARRVGRRLGIRSEAHLLLRLRDTPHQLALPIEQRAGNVHAAFAVEPRRRAELAGVDVAVIDDVMTTGATAAELAGVLRQAGAARVQIWVLARTPRPGPGP